MANHARDSRSVGDKRSALAGAQQRAYAHRDQVGGARRQEADGRWVDRPREDRPQSEPPRRKQGEPITLGQFVKNNAVYILSVVAVVAIVVLLVFGVRAFTGAAGTRISHGGGGEGYVTPYDWSKLDVSSDRYAYIDNGQVKSRFGIDVSEHEYEIDWDAVAADGVEFAMIRLGYRGATEGVIYLDEFFQSNFEGARSAGLDCGVYFFSQAVNEAEAIEEAEFVLEHLGRAPAPYTVAFDSEVVTNPSIGRTADLSNEEMTAIADAFCNRIEREGYSTIVYGNAYDLKRYDETALTSRGIWWAEYGVIRPSHTRDIVMWQYTDKGRVNGIDADVDFDLDLSRI